MTNLSSDDLAPSPSRLVESLRDTGYSYQAAFADIVDNSIAAGATLVEIDLAESIFGNDVTVCFYDNGSGMDEKALIEAMRYGSAKRPSPKSLGKFGMGLKTASTAFCRKLTVISKTNGSIFARCWDIDLIIESDQWLLVTPELSEYAEQISKLEEIATNGTGTIIIWEEVDRLISASGSDYTDQAVKHLISDIREHLEGVYGKFLIGLEIFNSDVRKESKPDVQIKINSEVLKGWDPTGKFLNTIEEHDRVLIERTQHSVSNYVNGERIVGKFELNGYILPNKSKMTDSELEAVRYSNDSQGFYIYRENRLILGGGWPHRLFSQDSHLNLLRVELNFDHTLDEYFEIDIRKSKINLPIKIRDELKNALAPWRNQAQKRYRQNGKVRPKEPIQPTKPSHHDDSSKAIDRQQKHSEVVEVVEFDRESPLIKIKNRFGEIEINRASVVEGTDVYVTTTSSLEGDMLWHIDMTDKKQIVVVLNDSHEFYKRFYLSTEITPVFVQAMDSLFWALANAELNSISDMAKRNFEELRFSLSRSLKHLANELPDAD